MKVIYLYILSLALLLDFSVKAQDYSATGNINLPNNKFIRGTRDSGGASNLIGFESSGQRIAISQYSTIPSEVRIYTPLDPGQGVSIYSNELIAFFKNNGRVGIGTASPAHKLDVHGSLGIKSPTWSADGWKIYHNADDSTNDYGLTFNRGVTPWMVLGHQTYNRIYFPTGSVGIGTNTPDAKLSIFDAGKSQQRAGTFQITIQGIHR